MEKVDVAGDHVVVRMHVRVCPELEAWILGFGEQAEVLAPAALRAKIAKRASGAAAVYAEGRRESVRAPLRKTAGRRQLSRGQSGSVRGQ